MWWQEFVNKLTASPIGKLAVIAAVDAAVESARPELQRHGMDAMVQVDPATMATQLDVVHRATGHTTIRHVPPAPMNLQQPVNLQPVTALWQQMQAAQNVMNAANAAQQNINQQNP